MADAEIHPMDRVARLLDEAESTVYWWLRNDPAIQPSEEPTEGCGEMLRRRNAFRRLQQRIGFLRSDLADLA
jgi:hypothetical protein